jgi:hypothetical protein
MFVRRCVPINPADPDTSTGDPGTDGLQLLLVAFNALPADMVALRRLAAAAAAAALSAALLPGPAGVLPAVVVDRRARLQASSSAAGDKPHACNLQASQRMANTGWNVSGDVDTLVLLRIHWVILTHMPSLAHTTSG